MSDTELLPKSKAEPFRRMEVFTGAGRRRAWSAEEKARIVTESYERGESVPNPRVAPFNTESCHHL